MRLPWVNPIQTSRPEERVGPLEIDLSHHDAARGSMPRLPLAGLTRTVLVQDGYGEDESIRLVTVMS